MAADNQEFEYARVQFWMQGFSLRLTDFFRNNTKETHGREIIIIKKPLIGNPLPLIPTKTKCNR